MAADKSASTMNINRIIKIRCFRNTFHNFRKRVAPSLQIPPIYGILFCFSIAKNRVSPSPIYVNLAGYTAPMIIIQIRINFHTKVIECIVLPISGNSCQSMSTPCAMHVRHGSFPILINTVSLESRPHNRSNLHSSRLPGGRE